MKPFGKKIKGILRLQILISAGLLLTFNTFAWFIYSSRVSNSITTSVRAWKINFEHGETEIAEYIDLTVDDLHPGMDDYHNTINIVNYGESSATIEYEIESVRIFDDVFLGENYTVTELETKLVNDYPFIIDLNLASNTLDPINGTVDFNIDISWSFESGDDELDTYWGNLAYLYKENNPESPGISLLIKLTAVQAL